MLGYKEYRPAPTKFQGLPIDYNSNRQIDKVHFPKLPEIKKLVRINSQLRRAPLERPESSQWNRGKSFCSFSAIDSRWTDRPLSTNRRELCYKNYNQNMTLPEWNIEQEWYWQVSTVNSIFECIAFLCVCQRRTLLQELQPKYDTSWMEYWTGKILTSFDSKFHFRMYCFFMRLSKKDFATRTTTKITKDTDKLRQYIPILNTLSIFMMMSKLTWLVDGRELLVFFGFYK